MSSQPSTSHNNHNCNANGTARQPVSTLVFLDLESTGLPKFSGKDNVYMTELCLVAVNRHDFINSKDGVPRIVNKLLLCVKPKALISPVSEKISGLHSDALIYQSEFTRATALQIQDFLLRLQQPVCLLAHNGNGFDFALLKSELSEAQISLNDDILCADTLICLRCIVPQHLDELVRKEEEEIYELTECCLNDHAENELRGFDLIPELSMTDLGFSIPNDISNWADPEKTPPSHRSHPTLPPLIKFWPPSNRHIHPHTNSQMISSSKLNSGPSSYQQNFPDVFTSLKQSACRRLPFSDYPSKPGDDVNAVPMPTINNSHKKFKGNIRYSLVNLHELLVGVKPDVSHTAEDDCLALMRVCHKVCNSFLSWIDKNAVLFKDAMPMR